MSMCGICWFDGRALTDERDDLRVRVSERDARIAELETLLREVLRQGCEYHTKKYALLQMDHALIQEIADAIEAAREGK